MAVAYQMCYRTISKLSWKRSRRKPGRTSKTTRTNLRRISFNCIVLETIWEQSDFWSSFSVFSLISSRFLQLNLLIVLKHISCACGHWIWNSAVTGRTLYYNGNRLRRKRLGSGFQSASPSWQNSIGKSLGKSRIWCHH